MPLNDNYVLPDCVKLPDVGESVVPSGGLMLNTSHFSFQFSLFLLGQSGLFSLKMNSKIKFIL